MPVGPMVCSLSSSLYLLNNSSNFLAEKLLSPSFIAIKIKWEIKKPKKELANGTLAGGFDALLLFNNK